jgi:hypothetical protein
MSSSLTRIPFSEALLPRVQGFACGEESWQWEVSAWIKAPRGSAGALDELERGAQVWLYVDGDGELVGFGSLAAALQRWPRSKDPPVPASATLAQTALRLTPRSFTTAPGKLAPARSAGAWAFT